MNADDEKKALESIDSIEIAQIVFGCGTILVIAASALLLWSKLDSIQHAILGAPK